ncbi:7576_t:CDS:2 [Diversispora eburnea]|uniref:7576_t:CDS:1 n=1 Tax=Diversispora eburnea TaxID=1213867 RepID=A0A9N9BDR4_9GLOM|nr:7576_t:CDS:2 [Diversispora eburnea]
MHINYVNFIISKTRPIFKSFYFIKNEFCSLTPICYARNNKTPKISNNKKEISNNDNKKETDEISINDDKKALTTTGKKLRNYCIWTEQDEQILLDAVEKYGTKWDYISKNCFQTIRTPGSVEKKWYLLKQKIKRTSYHNPWTTEEDEILKKGVLRYGVGQWSIISTLLPRRDDAQLFNRWNLLIKSKRGRWSEEEHKLVIKLVNKYGRNWAIISNLMNRPNNYIQNHYDQHVLNSKWTIEDKNLLHKALKEHGENWGEIMKYFPRRTLANVKSHFITAPSCNPNVNCGRWSDKEKQAFIEAYEKHGKKWKLVSAHVGPDSWVFVITLLVL